MNIWSKRPLPYLLALALGAFLTLAFAPFNLYPLAILAPAGLFYLWLNASKKQAFWLGAWFGTGLFSTGIYWIFISIHQFGNVPSSIASLLTALLIFVLALFPASAGYVIKRYYPAPSPLNVICVYPTVWILLTEWLRSFLFWGFPWLFTGYSQTSSPLKGFAPVFGVYGVSLATLMTSALLVSAYLLYKQKKYFSICLNITAAILIWIIGASLSSIVWTQPDGKPLSISLVQANIPQSIKWDPNHLQLSFDRYIELTNPLWGNSDLIIWPEAAIPLTMEHAADFINALDEKAQETNTQLILGIPVEGQTEETFHNAIIALGKERGFYLKRLLVPFGEYIPFKRFVSGLFDVLHVPMSNLSPGKPHQPPLAVKGIHILPSICFEIAFPDLMRTSDQSIGMLLTVTNDAWFGKSTAQAQHLQMAQMRAIEFNRPALFVSNDGVTAVIASDGAIAASAPDHEIAVLRGTVQPRVGLTPWMYIGSDSILLISMCLLYIARRQKRAAIKYASSSINETQQAQGLSTP